MCNAPLVITRNEIEYYLALLKNTNENIQRDGLQRLFQEMIKGRRLLPGDKIKIEQALDTLIQSPVLKVRKWALHMATSMKSGKVIKACVNQLHHEHDPENINWILAALSREYNNKELLDLLRKTRSSNPSLYNISKLQIDASTALFSKDPVENISAIVQDLRHSDPNTRSWLTKLYGYQDLAYKRNMNGYVTQKDMIELVTDGDIGLQEYGMWGLYLHGSQNISDIPHDLLDNSIYCDDTLKWFFPFVRYVPTLAHDEDMIASWIQRPNVYNRSAREGLMKLLLLSSFSNKYIEPLVDWYIEEEYASVKCLLIQYIVCNAIGDNTDTFFSLLESEFHNTNVRTMIESEIKLNPAAALDIIGDRIQRKGRGTIMHGKYDKIKSEHEKNDAVLPYGVINVCGSTITNLQIQQGTLNSSQSNSVSNLFDYQIISDFLAMIYKYEISDSEFGIHTTEFKHLLELLEEAVSQRSAPTKIKKLLEAMRDLTIGISGSLIASGIATRIPTLMQQLGL